MEEGGGLDSGETCVSFHGLLNIAPSSQSGIHTTENQNPFDLSQPERSLTD
jgi:hypothetical protein